MSCPWCCSAGLVSHAFTQERIAAVVPRLTAIADELLDALHIILAAGHETTVNAITNTVVALLTHPRPTRTPARRPPAVLRQVRRPTHGG
jgi:cytochrome P450